jgi:hypothetical protein
MWQGNIKVGRIEIRWGDLDWIDMAEDRDRWRALVNRVINLRMP